MFTVPESTEININLAVLLSVHDPVQYIAQIFDLFLLQRWNKLNFANPAITAI